MALSRSVRRTWNRPFVLVTVYQKPASLTLSPDSVSLEVDGTATMSASVMDANGHDIPLAEGDKGGLVVFWRRATRTWRRSTARMITPTGTRAPPRRLPRPQPVRQRSRGAGAVASVVRPR